MTHRPISKQITVFITSRIKATTVLDLKRTVEQPLLSSFDGTINIGLPVAYSA